MTNTAIEVTSLSKKYQIGRAQQRHDTLRDLLVDAIKMPFTRRGNSQDDIIWALKDVSFTVDHGEVLGIIGRNGAGKSTLLKILSRITEPTSGRITLNGRVASLLEVGTGFHPELTGRENIYLNGAILGMHRSEIDRKFDEIVAFSEIEKFLDTPVKRYSSGMYVRLAFAVAAHLEPEILVVDEVLAVGDAQFQKKCLGKMADVASEGRTVLFVSHNIAAILNLCTRTLLLSNGKIIKDGESQTVVDHYFTSQQIPNQLNFEMSERIGNHRATIENFLVNPNPPRTGMPVEFTFIISKESEIDGDLIGELAISFLTEHGTRLFHLFSKHMGRSFTIKEGKSSINVKLDYFPLVPGNYHLNLWLGNGNVPIDWLKDCFLMNVETGSYIKGSYIESSGYPVIVPSTWNEAQVEDSYNTVDYSKSLSSK